MGTFDKGFIKELCIAIINYVNEKDGTVTKTKLLKFLYLIDIEYFRIHKQLLTDFNWFYYKFGPYASEYENVYSELANQDITVKTINNFEYEAQILEAKREKSLNITIDDVQLRLKVKSILDTWAKEPLAKILDYVYFDTGPMNDAQKNATLDFQLIDKEDKSFRITYPKVSKAKINAIRAKVIRKDKQIKNSVTINELFQPESYGEEYWNDLSKLDNEAN